MTIGKPSALRQIRLASTFLALLASIPAWANSGWTDAGTISSLEQDPANNGSVSLQVFVVVSISVNPSSCSSATGFYFSVSDDRTKRLFAMLMAAQLAGRPVRIYTTGNCHTVGYSELDGVQLAPP